MINLSGAKVVITGGCGFIGTNLAHRLLVEKCHVIILDNLSRIGTMNNLHWLINKHPNQRIEFIRGDVRCTDDFKKLLYGADYVVHLAAQVAVTKSILDPVEDFDINLKGTFNILECLRNMSRPPVLLYTSTNKVYGQLNELTLFRNKTRYEKTDSNNKGNQLHVNFCSPYGCSKGAADQYALDYSRIYNLKTVVFRMSCIYGPHQYGNEDQGWVAHFLWCMAKGRKVTVYGDGYQVRDLLFVDDLIDAMIMAFENISVLSGNAFPIGGGIENTISIRELIEYMEKKESNAMNVNWMAWRPGDQKYYVSDLTSFSDTTAWKPKTTISEGLDSLYDWIKTMHKEEIRIQNTCVKG
jgi:CDP-paratose 2-epimerase